MSETNIWFEELFLQNAPRFLDYESLSKSQVNPGKYLLHTRHANAISNNEYKVCVALYCTTGTISLWRNSITWWVAFPLRNN